MIASSPEGKFLATGDSNGTIRIYNFNHFSLFYQLSCENMINDIPSAQTADVYTIFEVHFATLGNRTP